MTPYTKYTFYSCIHTVDVDSQIALCVVLYELYTINKMVHVSFNKNVSTDKSEFAYNA